MHVHYPICICCFGGNMWFCTEVFFAVPFALGSLQPFYLGSMLCSNYSKMSKKKCTFKIHLIYLLQSSSGMLPCIAVKIPRFCPKLC